MPRHTSNPPPAASRDDPVTLCEALDRALHKGVVAHGEITISVANIDLVYLGFNVLLSSVATAERLFLENERSREAVPA